MKIFIFDLDDTIIYYPFGLVNYNNIRMDITLSRLLNNMNIVKYIYSNGTYGHVKVITDKMRITHNFKKIFARDTMPEMKPHINSYKFVEKNIKKDYNDKNKYYFFDDRLDNLHMAKTRGWNTIWIHINFIDKPYYVDYAFPNIHTALLYFSMEE